MKKVYVVGSSSKVSESLVRLSEHSSVTVIGRTNPHGLSDYIHFGGITAEESVDELFALIRDDVESTKDIESIALVILSGVSTQDWRESFLVNEYLPAKLSEYFANYASENQLLNASIALVSSAVAYQGSKLPYATTKASLAGILHTIARDFRNMVRINIILPSAFDSEMIADWDAEKRQSVASNNYIGRLGTADDMADAILFTIRNQFITNSTINMTGGTVHI